MGVIDILTPYDAKKKAAHAAKTVKHGVGISASFTSKTFQRPSKSKDHLKLSSASWKQICFLWT